MGHFISFVLVLLIGASGFLLIYLLIDFFEYLRKYQTVVYEQLCFERPFGIPQKDFFFYPIKPLKFIPFLLSGDDSQDRNLAGYKKRIKYSFIGLMAIVCFNFLVRSFI
jgi:hypothetical protein